MKIKLNDNNIYTDYIKTILQDNNLYNYTSDLYDHSTHLSLVKYLNHLKQEKNIDLFDLINLADNNYLNKYKIEQVLVPEEELTETEEEPEEESTETETEEESEEEPEPKPYSLKYRMRRLKKEDKLFKIYKIPVSWDIGELYNTATFTIKLDSLKQPVIVAGVGYKNNKIINNKIYNPTTYYNKQLTDSITIEFEIKREDEDGNRLNAEILDNFYLIVSTAKDVKDIVVTKGQVEIDAFKFISDTNNPILCDSKLIEYMTNMIIHEGSDIEDIIYFQKILSSPEFRIKFNMGLENYNPGEYDDIMISFISDFQEKYVKTSYRKGYIDKETEREIRSIE